MRRTSVSLPTNKIIAHDRHEKPARYGAAPHRGGRGFFATTAAYMSQSKQARWIKVTAVLATVVLLFYWFSPSGVDLYNGVSKGPNRGGQTPADASYGTDKCTQSSSRDKPIIQYVLMIDAGSTGSRIHVYKFNNCGATPELEEETFKMTKKIEGQSSGLSAYPDDPEAAAKSLDILMDEAVKVVPDKLKGCSPVAVKATAGLRLLGDEKSARILDAVRTRLETKYPFPVVSKEEGGVEIMEGKMEAVNAWVTINYLLGNIGAPEHSDTAAVFDLGGGSTQIVFEPNYKGLSRGGIPEKMAPGDHLYETKFGGRDFELYQHSHLGYGLMSARDEIYKTLINDLLAGDKDAKFTKKPIINPCYAAGMDKTVTVKLGKDHPLGATVELNMTGPSSPAPAQCRGIVERLLKKDAECRLAPCSFNGVHQPSIAKTFSRSDMYFLSYFYDRIQVLGMPETFTLQEMMHLTEQVCGGEKHWGVFGNVPGALDELSGRPEHCMDLNFMFTLAHTGYDMPLDREVRIAKKIKGNELGWCLGASLPLLSHGSGWTCKVNRVQ